MNDYCPNCNSVIIDFFPLHCHIIGKYKIEYMRTVFGLPPQTWISLDDQLLVKLNKLIPIENEQRIEILLMLQ